MIVVEYNTARPILVLLDPWTSAARLVDYSCSSFCDLLLLLLQPCSYQQHNYHDYHTQNYHMQSQDDSLHDDASLVIVNCFRTLFIMCYHYTRFVKIDDFVSVASVLSDGKHTLAHTLVHT